MAEEGDRFERLVSALERMTVGAGAPAAATPAPRVRAINCKSYKIGEDWGHFVDYFRENVRSAYQYQPTDPLLDRACCDWIASRLEVGATQSVYQNLDDSIKTNWNDLKTALARLYVNEEEKQLFLANPGGYKKGTQTLMEYKNELVRLINLYQPELQRVNTEYQRALVLRFIEGIEDTVLQKKLRFHCKRARMNIESAYEFAVDYESTETEVKVREVAASSRSLSAYGAAASAVVSNNPVYAAADTSAANRVMERSVDPKTKAVELGLEQVKAGLAQTNDDVAEMKQSITKMESMMAALTFKVMGGGSTGPRPPTYNQSQPRPPMTYNQPQMFIRGRGRGIRGRPITPGLTGGPGYVDNTQGQNWTPTNLRPTPNVSEASAPMTSNSAQQHTATSMASVMSVPQVRMPAPMPTMQHSIPPQAMTYPPVGPSHYESPQQHFEPMHPVADEQQNTFPHDNFWAEHLQYEPSPMGYGAMQGGVYSYYPQGFQ